jgi:hypothetical protein
MSSDLCGKHTAVVSDPCDVKRNAVYIPTTVHGPRTGLLGVVMYPLYCTGIADKNFELVKLKEGFLLLK